MSSPPPISRYEEVAGALRSGAFELFTCDVFDTLVWRAVARPTDLFVSLGQLLIDRGLVPKDLDPVEFSGTRQWAEADARRGEERSCEGGELDFWRNSCRGRVHDSAQRRATHGETHTQTHADSDSR